MEKMLNSFLKISNNTEKVIKDYIIANASEALTEKILNGTKNISDCLNFIKGEAKKQAISGCAILTDEEVFGLAIHYFEEDSIKPGEKIEAKVESTIKTGGIKPNGKAGTITVKKEKLKKEVKPEPEIKVKQLSLFDFED